MNQKLSKREKKVVGLVLFLGVNLAYKYFVQQALGVRGASDPVVIVSPDLTLAVDIFMDLTGIIALLWLCVEVYRLVRHRKSPQDHVLIDTPPPQKTSHKPKRLSTKTLIIIGVASILLLGGYWFGYRSHVIKDHCRDVASKLPSDSSVDYLTNYEACLVYEGL